MATGIARRGGAYLAAASLVPHILAANAPGATDAEKKSLRGDLVRNLALLGAALVVSQDTAGQPSLVWRAADTRKRLAREADRAKRTVSHETGHAAKLLAKDPTRLTREAQLQARAARRSIEGALA